MPERNENKYMSILKLYTSWLFIGIGISLLFNQLGLAYLQLMWQLTKISLCHNSWQRWFWKTWYAILLLFLSYTDFHEYQKMPVFLPQTFSDAGVQHSPQHLDVLDYDLLPTSLLNLVAFTIQMLSIISLFVWLHSVIYHLTSMALITFVYDVATICFIITVFCLILRHMS